MRTYFEGQYGQYEDGGWWIAIRTSVSGTMDAWSSPRVRVEAANAEEAKAELQRQADLLKQACATPD